MALRAPVFRRGCPSRVLRLAGEALQPMPVCSRWSTRELTTTSRPKDDRSWRASHGQLIVTNALRITLELDKCHNGDVRPGGQLRGQAGVSCCSAGTICPTRARRCVPRHDVLPSLRVFSARSTPNELRRGGRQPGCGRAHPGCWAPCVTKHTNRSSPEIRCRHYTSGPRVQTAQNARPTAEPLARATPRQ